MIAAPLGRYLPQLAPAGDLVATYSIVACDPEQKQMGCAVHSHYFGVGAVVPWAEAGVGVVATQSLLEMSYGPLGLALMRAGKTAEQALAALQAADPAARIRQVAMLDAQGNVAVHTGANCIPAAGHYRGQSYSAQANLMLKDTVWGAMAQAFEATSGELADRLFAALAAAEAEGGDIRGKQSAALLVVVGERPKNPWEGRLYDLRVDDHPAPLAELQRLLATARYYQYGRLAVSLVRNAALGEERFALAQQELERARAFMPADNPEMMAHFADALVSAGRLSEALPLYAQVFEAIPNWRALIPRLAEVGLLPGDQELNEKITGV